MSRPFNRNGSGNGRSKELVDARRDELRARQGGNRIGCLDVAKCREVDRHRRVDAMTLTRAGVTAVVGAHGSVATRRGVFDHVCRVIRRRLNALLGVVGRMRGTIQLCRCRSYRYRRHRHRRSHCLGDLQLQPEHQLKRQQHKQHGPEANSFGDLTTSHRVELTPETRNVMRGRCARARDSRPSAIGATTT